MTGRHFCGLEGARTIKTAPFALTEQAVDDLAAHRAMGVVYGQAGLGKTFAVEHILDRRPDLESYWFDFPERTTQKWLTCDLLELLTGVDHEGEHRKLRRELLEVLSERPRFLIVDEAQRLNRACVEHLRHLHDHRETTFTLLLVGGNGCWETLSRHAMLRSRIWRRVEFRAMSSKQVLEVIPGFHEIYEDVGGELLLLVDDLFAHGIFRNWSGFTASASDLCEEHGLKTLNEDIARAVFTKHGGGFDA
jgi:DNA transposition AAA+ family ATPase